MWHISFNNDIHIFNLLENLIAFINHKHYIIINTKNYSSRVNNAHTMSLANMLAAPQKSYGQQHPFWILSIFSYSICVGPLAGQHGMSAHGVGWNIFIITKYNIQIYDNEHILLIVINK